MGVWWGREIHMQLAGRQWSPQSDPGCILKVEPTGFPAGLDVQENYPRRGLSKREEGAASDEAGPAARGPRGELQCPAGAPRWPLQVWILERRPGWGWELGSWDPTASGSGAWTRPRGVSGAKEESKHGAQGALGGGGGGRAKRRKWREPGGAASTGSGSQDSNLRLRTKGHRRP